MIKREYKNRDCPGGNGSIVKRTISMFALSCRLDEEGERGLRSKGDYGLF